MVIIKYSYISVGFGARKKKSPDEISSGDQRDCNYSLGPASTRALPSSLPVYLLKFLMKRAARS